MNWPQFIKRTAVRRVVWIVVGLAVYALLSVMGVAHAQDYTNCQVASEYYGTCPSRQEAYSGAMARGQHECSRIVWPYSCLEPVITPTLQGNGGSYMVQIRREDVRNGAVVLINAGQRFWSVMCPNGGEWNEELKRCFDPNECLARNQEDGFRNVGPIVRGFSEACLNGCQWRMMPGTGGCVTIAHVDGGRTCWGEFEFSGNVCGVPPPPPPVAPRNPEPPQECQQASHNQSFCLKPNGENCYTASTGRQICWEPGETGTKTDGDTAQIRRAGTEAPHPENPNLPSGDKLAPSGDPITTTTTRNNSGGGATVIVTTTQNHTTEQGTNAGTGKDGEPGDGSGAPDGKGDDDKGTADGGGDCDSRPIIRGGDPVIAMVADQAWATRCAVEAGNAAKVTGDVGDCKSDFSVEGDNANAHQLRAMREQICGEGERAERTGDGDALGSAAGELESEFGENVFGSFGGDGQGINPNWLGFGGGCPVISIDMGPLGTFQPPPMFCSVVAALALLFQLVAMVWALQIVGS